MFELSRKQKLNFQSIVKEISPIDLQKLFKNNSTFQLIDVREEWEKEIADIGGEIIPLGEIPDNLHKIASDKLVVFYCRSGKRSANAILQIESKLRLKNLYNLSGGILAWSDDVDSLVKKY